jgi:OmpA-OmpF porin, OOP family
MRTIRVFGLAVSALALLASPSFANPTVKGFYVGAGAGATFPMDNEIESQTGLQTHKLSFDPGWLVDGQVGYAFGNGLRTEVEVGYRQAENDSITNPYNNAGLSGSGNYGVLNSMVNVLYDMDINTRLTPYIGVGVGYAYVWAKDLGIASSGTSLLSATDKSAGAFAYQGIAGFSYDIMPHWAATLDYRYLATTSLDFGNVKSEYSSHNVMLGLRYEFNTPAIAAAVPVAAAAPMLAAPAAGPVAVPNTYIVFFDFDKALITKEAKSILTAVAAEYKKGKTVRVNVTGHADRSGKDKYNDKLSVKRSTAVKAELARLGVPSKAVVTSADGEKQPLVPTADGVREAQNRRAEIVLGQ